jgi:DNA polymerase I-like protein with 3'-5' exonuclease and polymerase domains
MKTTYSFDFETFYSRDYSVATLGNYGYTHHPEFDPYLLTVEGDNGFEWAGHPKEFEWDRFSGSIVVAHNAGFELAITRRLVELGSIPPIGWDQLYDTADLAAYLGVPRSLAEATKALLGVTVDKSARGEAKGLHWNEMTPAFQEKMLQYAKMDAKLELALWTKHQHRWPEWERRLSQLTRDMCEAGVPIDLEGVEDAIRKLNSVLWTTRTQIPWAEDPDAVVLSPKKAAGACRAQGVEPPKSWAKNDQCFEHWLNLHREKFPWAEAMGEYRSQNMLLKKLQTLRDRTVNNGAGYAVMPYGMKYAGAHTLRDSGDQGFNIQNLPKKPMHGVDLRGLICAPEGFTFGIVDLRAIEPCVLAWFAEDEDMLARLLVGEDMYEAWARMTHGYEDPRPLKEVNPTLRQLCKVEVLGLGYGAGVDKFMQMPSIMEIDVKIEREQAEESVRNFRARQYIPYLWEVLEQKMLACTNGTYEMELPSGRVMRYREVRYENGRLQALIPRMGKMMRMAFWGGSLTENLVQATSRDVFMHGVLQLEAAGLPPCIRVHDEAVCLLPEETAEEDLRTMNKCMSVVPEWIQGLPLFTEGKLSKRYTK